VTVPARAQGTDTADLGHPRRWLILGVLVLALQVVVLDTSVLNVALKIMTRPAPRGLGAGQSQLEWAVNAYILAFAGLLFTWGLLADRFGRKRVLMLGTALFGLASLWCAYAAGPGELIAARAVLGVGGAAIMPSTLAVIADVFPRAEQGKAVGLWTGSVGLAVATGPVVGGTLLGAFWWGSVFLINVPIAVAVLIAVAALVPESKNPDPGRLDPVGVLLLLAGLVTFVYGVVRGGDSGDWTHPTVWAPVLGGLALIAAFVRWELRTGQPALDVRLFRNRGFSAAVASVALNYFTLMGGMFCFTFYLQAVRGYSPLRAGLWSLPFAASQLIFSPLSPRMVGRFGARAVASVGLFGISAAFLGYQLTTTTSPAWVYGVMAFTQGSFMANVMPPATTAVMASLPREQAGIGSSVNNTMRQVGGALGVAALGTVLTTAYRGGVEPLLRALPGIRADQVRQAGGSIQATQAEVADLAAAHPQDTRLLAPANDAFIHAMHLTTLTAAGVLAAAGLLVLAWMPPTALLCPPHPRVHRGWAGRKESMPASFEPPSTETAPPVRRLSTRLTLAVLVAVPACVAFGLLAVAVESAWNPFRSLDQRVASDLHAQVAPHPAWVHVLTAVTNAGGPTTFRVLVGVLAVGLWIRGARHLALWAVAVMAAGAVLDTVLKSAVGRVRPHLPNPLASAPGGSFPSGHALAATLGCGVIILVLLPVLHRRGRVAAWTLGVIVVGAVSYTRVALGVHWVTDVVGSWILGIGLLAAATSAFGTWRREDGKRPVRPLTEGVDPEESTEAMPGGHTA
jgi:MFS transporter, DHA2 family, multidrug resistance protein